jgi:hypothetical protein
MGRESRFSASPGTRHRHGGIQDRIGLVDTGLAGRVPTIRVIRHAMDAQWPEHPYLPTGHETSN